MFKAWITTIIFAFIFQTGVFAQIYVKNTGDVGIGYTTPDFKLQVDGNTEITDKSAHDPTRYGTLQLTRPADQGDNRFHLSFIRQGNAVTGIGYARNANIFGIWAFTSDNLNVPTISCHYNGNVGIGIANPAYKLHIAGEVRAAKYWSDAGNQWADYVFDSAYQLPSLQQVKAYINQNHHLPEVPSAEDVKKDGVNLSDNQVILLKKVEELTLYIIEQNEKLQILQQKMNNLLEENKKQQTEIENLKEKKGRR